MRFEERGARRGPRASSPASTRWGAARSAARWSRPRSCSATGFDREGLDDSKRLTRRQRERSPRASARARAASAVGIGRSPAEIDRINILRATLLAMRRAVGPCPVEPDLLLVDALTVPGLDVEQRPIVKGDAHVRVDRGRLDRGQGRARRADARAATCEHPGYDLARNMGYGSEEHRDWPCGRLGPSADPPRGPSPAPRVALLSEAAGLAVAAKKVNPIKLKQDADAAEKTGDSEKAIELLKQIVQDNPRDWNTINRIGDLYAKLNKLKDANEQYAKVAELLRRGRLPPQGDRGLEEDHQATTPPCSTATKASADLYAKQGLMVEAKQTLRRS